MVQTRTSFRVTALDAIERLLARPQVAFLHSRNVLYGCYMFAIERDGDRRIAT